MKKVYDYDIAISVKLPDFKRTFKMVLSVHTNAHKVCMKAAQLLGYDQFTSTLQLYCNDQHHPVNPIQTLYQHGVREGDTLVIKMVHAVLNREKATYISDTKLIGLVQKQKYNSGKTSRAFGLIVEGVCVNAKCINFGKDVQLPMGTGQFDFYHINTRLKCPLCPYRAQYQSPSLTVKALKMVNCIWKCSGEYRQKRGLVLSKSFSWQRAQGEQSKSFINKMKEEQWLDLKINVKPL